MKAVITVLGKDTVGILAKVSSACAEEGVNIIEVTQSVMQDLFAMIMLAEIKDADVTVEGLTKKLDKVGEEMGVKVHVMHEDIFNSMHKI
ncbi:MAG: ACT domain-containing protein [Ruminococcus sp.]|nr:ACT domain-containing protein [Ruminococcus sp.]